MLVEQSFVLYTYMSRGQMIIHTGNSIVLFFYALIFYKYNSKYIRKSDTLKITKTTWKQDN